MDRPVIMAKQPDKTQSSPAALRISLLLFAGVLVPAIILAVLAIRFLSHEAAYIEKQFQTSVNEELSATKWRVHDMLKDLQEELNVSAPKDLQPGIRESLATWKAGDSIVGVPFLFVRTGDFLYPPSAAARQSSEERDFLKFNLSFFQDQKPAELYKSLTKKYSLEILALEKPKAEKPADKMDDAGLASGAQPAAAMSSVNMPMKKSAVYVEQRAMSAFEQDEELQQKIFSKAKSESRLASRNVAPAAQRSKDAAAAPPPAQTAPSMYITESIKFSEIVSQGKSGIIPRIIDDRMMLIYWRHYADNRIIGCSIDERELKNRIVQLISQIYTDARILTILDQNGEPLISPELKQPINWHFPFASVEIGELLPRWEAAAYLTDPDFIASQARHSALMLGILIAFLFVTIATGGFLVVRALQIEVRQAQQKTTFVANVSHELKTPLTSIRLFAEMMKEGRQTDPEKRRTYLDIMVSETDRLTRLINNVLDFSRSKKGRRIYDKKPVNIIEVCREMVENQKVRLEHNGFSVSFETSIAEVNAVVDPEAVKQALLNLLSNSEKYSADEKWVRIEIGKDDSAVLIRVMDHGIGVKAADTKKLFREFFRADDSLTARVRGTGLGLAISRQIIRDHGGDIRYMPNHPKGSVFEIRIPV